MEKARRIGRVAMLLIGCGLALRGGCLAAERPQIGSHERPTGGGYPPQGVAPVLPGTTLLHHSESVESVDGDAADMIDQHQYDEIRTYFSKQIARTPFEREQLWKVNFTSSKAYGNSVEVHRQHLKELLGFSEMKVQKVAARLLADETTVRIEEVKLTLDGDFRARVLIFSPKSPEPKPAVIAVPDVSQTPEEFAGTAEGMEAAGWLRRLLRQGIVVAIPQMVERRTDDPLCSKAGGADERRMLWRLGYITGKSLVGMEAEQVIATADYLAKQPGIESSEIAVWGEGQGGMTALYAAAMDEKLAGATVAGYFQQREDAWKEPVDRTLYGQLKEFGDAELGALIAPRPLTILTETTGPIPLTSVAIETDRARRFFRGLRLEHRLKSVDVRSDIEGAGAKATASLLSKDLDTSEQDQSPRISFRMAKEPTSQERNAHFQGLYAYLRQLCVESDSVRNKYWMLRSTPAQARPQKVSMLRKELSQLEGVLPDQNIPLHPRSLLIAETDKFLAYEVVLNTVPGVEAYGHLLVPRDPKGNPIKDAPAVICQHGFGGAPKYVSGVGSNIEVNDHFYHRFGERLAERGYVVFAPYLTVPAKPGKDRSALIDPIVREAATLGMMRTSVEVAKLHRIVDFLQSLPFVDGHRIGYYGLSYGGYSATWMPPVEPRLRFTIISGHFTDWRQELTAEGRHDYWTLPDEDFFNWNILNRFTHTELIAAMWPRPVCIEWGLNDGTTTPEWHRSAWDDLESKFIGPWDMKDKVLDDAYIGPHTIHGIGTFLFIDRWLRPDHPAGRDYACDGEHYCYLNLSADQHGYAPSTEASYVMHRIDSTGLTDLKGTFYVSSKSPELSAFALKASRSGNPGALVVRLGSREGAGDLGILELSAQDAEPAGDSWHELPLRKPVLLDPNKLYWFEISVAPGKLPQDGYVLYGPKPLGGTDYPDRFGLSFQIKTDVDR